MKPGRSTRQGRNLVVYWQELSPVKLKMDKILSDWFTLFVRAYHLHDKKAAVQIAQGEALANLIAEAMYMSNEHQRLHGRKKGRATRPYGSNYSAYDYNRSGASYDPEQALVDALDELNGGELEVLLQEFHK